ncbi:MAG TPA: FtsX-like permease family protein [Gemmatales bacterium]|nr:FtsX-like permease family protein [Gemmatales bacterium]
MTRLTLILRNLAHFLTANLLIVVGVAIGTAVLTGALLLGDSLKGSLAQLTLDRLGNIESALISERFFPANLADRLKNDPVPIVLLRGTVLRRPLGDDKLLARAGRVQIVGVDPRFWPLFNEKRDKFDGMLINQALADALQMTADNKTDGLEVRMEKPGSVPSESVLGQRSEEAVLTIEKAPLAGILPNTGSGRFSLQPTQGDPLILYVNLDTLQRRLAADQQLPEGAANVLLATTPYVNEAYKSPIAIPDLASNAKVNATPRTSFDEAITLADMGFTLKTSSDPAVQVLTSRRMLIEPAVVTAVDQAAEKNGWPATPTLTYLANRIFRLDGNKVSKEFVPYSTIVGASSRDGIFKDGLILSSQVIINEFVAQDLGPDVKKIRIEYFVETDGHKLVEQHVDLEVKAIVPITGAAADKTWAPEFPGMKGPRGEKKALRDWNPPFPKDQWHANWVRRRDEEYFTKYEATPKLFISPVLAQKLFSSRFGNATSIRIKAPKAEVEQMLAKTIRPEMLGMVWLNAKQQGLLSSSQGATTNMFGGLFAGFSLFLIVSAALLVALLFRLRMERRANEIGTLLATGWPVKLARRTLMSEGFLLAILGTLVGIPLAIGYAKLMIAGIRSGWGGLLASDSLSLHFTPTTLIIGAVISLLIALLSMFLSLRSLVKVPTPTLLAGRTETTTFDNKPSRAWVRWLPLITGILALGLIAFGATLPVAQQPGCFFGAGFLILFTGIMLLSRYLRRHTGQALGTNSTLWSLGQLNAGRSPGRSLLTVALLAAGCFLVVAVGAFRQGTGNVTDKNSGTGGFLLVAETDVPLRTVPINKDEWKSLLGDRYESVAKQVELVSNLNWFGFRLRSGDDVSCLNLYQPTKPRVLGATDAFCHRGGFDVSLGVFTMDKAIQANPWLYLATSDILNLFIDDHTAQWVLQKEPRTKFSLNDETNQPREAFFAAVIKGSIFQSELVMSEANFRKLFPSEAGYRYFLIDTTPEKMNAVRNALEIIFGESHGMTVQTTASKITLFHAVENTYLGTFQALGGLGLLLGTAGLAIVLLRNVEERKSELALLLAVGYSRKQVAWTIWSEVCWLVLMGLLIGCVSALVVVLPLITTATVMQLLFWLALVAILVPLVAIVSSLAGIRLALSTPLIPALRGE